MFRHKGKRRSYIHNLRLASLLSFVAGIVNISGLLYINILTTNLTGHFAYFSDTIVNADYSKALVYLLFIFSFLSGSFISSFLAELTAKRNQKLSYVLPIFTEAGLLLSVTFLNHANADIIAALLLMSMGIQNSLVTRVSQFVVRTTHLTGLFTDLGIELSQLCFHKNSIHRFKLKKSIYLKLVIIVSFFMGGITGGFSYTALGIKTLFIACSCLLVALLYDFILFNYYKVKRKLNRI
jgi:uncharacterized membrane protein YoaK (UPF0700 family)